MNQIKNIASKYRKDKIVVIGKGASVRDINLKDLSDFFVVNINDSESIISGDVALFYKTDVFESIRSIGFKSANYIAPSYLKIPDAKHIEVSYRPSDQDSFDYMYDYFQDEKFYLTDFLLLSVIKFAIIYQQVLDKKVSVYFVGFDFSQDKSQKTGSQYDGGYIEAFFRTQESYFSSVLHHFKEVYESIDLLHVGEKNYSSLSIAGFNKLLIDEEYKNTASKLISNSVLYQKLMRKVNEEDRVIVVAEFTNNHVGDIDRLLKMIRIAKESGADMIKLQKRDVDSFYTDKELSKPYDSPFGKTLGDYRRGVELTKEMFDLVDEECRKFEIPWFTSVLDWNSYEFMLQFDTVLIKLPSTISNHKNYLLRVGQHFKGDLVISTGFTEKEYENFVLENFTENRNIFLLQCTSSYPTPPDACQVAVVRHYDHLQVSYPNLYAGYSSHDVGSLGCMLAVAAGAKMLEKHVKLGDLEWIHFDGVALDLYNNSFKNFVQDVRKAELMCGTKEKKVHDTEHHKYVPNETSN